MTRFLKPGEGRTVDQEDGSPWPADGMEAELTLFVRRRIDDLDLIDAARPTSEPAAEPLPETPPAAEPADPTTKRRTARGSKTAGDA